MMPWGWERRNKDAARVVGLICSSAAAAGPGYEPKGAWRKLGLGGPIYAGDEKCMGIAWAPIK